MPVATAKITPRLKERYYQEIAPALTEKFGYANPMQVPKIEKVTLNMGVGDAKAGLLLDHRARSTTSTRRQRLERLSGRLSTTRTVSPAPASLRSSCACSVEEERTIFL